MDERIGELIVVWTARLAVAAYVVRLWADIRRGNPVCRTAIEPRFSADEQSGEVAAPLSGKPDFGERFVLSVWTLGCGIYLLHVAAAFHFAHHWSHTAAYEHTALQTAAVTGWHWGGGLWINYLFTIWWPIDVLWCWSRGLNQLPHWYITIVHVIVGFIMLNATVVFGPIWWGPVALFVGVVILLARRNRANGGPVPGQDSENP